ncbi:MAG: class I SAM-dependent methyltransferase [Ktedonobacterales bacterium]
MSEMANSREVKERVRQMFSRAADAYVTSPSHAGGEDLAELLELAAPQPSDLALDISTGGGHTTLAVAPHVAEVIASDLTPRILQAARDFITAQGVSNVVFVVADAEQLPFLDASFDLVTVRIAPHHYANVRAATLEMARVLVPGGRLVLIDNVAPEDTQLDQYVNEWERRRDPSHVRAYTATEWRTFLAEAGLQVQQLKLQSKPIDFVSWAERMQMPSDEEQHLEADMLAAPEPVRDHFKVTEENGRLISWSTDYVVLLATK